MLVMEEKEVHPLLTPEQVAQLLNTSERNVWDLLRSGELVGIKLGRRWRVDPLELEKFIERNKKR